MNTWIHYYEGKERRMNLINEARLYRLMMASMNLKDSRAKKSSFKVHTKLDAKMKDVSFECK